MCNPEEYELHTVIFPFAQQYFEWWWCSSNVYLLLGFCQFRRACFQHDNSSVAKLRKFILDRQMNFNINFFARVHNTVFTWPVWITCTTCVMKGRVQLGSRWRKLSFILVQREMGYKETLRERSQCLDKVTKGWSAKYWTKKQSRPTALPWISNSMQCSRPSYLK